MPKTETIRTVWEVWSFDVWGNSRDGYEVNDRACLCRALELDIPVVVHNAGTPAEFRSASPTDKQIRAALNIRPRVQIQTDGDDAHITVDIARNGYPAGELILVSPSKLSPIS